MRSYTYDVVVAGGGMAGVAAALGARRAGARVALLERHSFLGGNATAGGIHVFCGVFSCGHNPVKVVNGVYDELAETYERLGGHVKYFVSATGNTNVHFSAELLKYTLDTLLADADVDVYLDADLIRAETDGNMITAVTCADDAGEFELKASCFVDATGHGKLATLSGAHTLWGDRDGKIQAVCMSMRLENADMSYSYTPSDFETAVRKAKEAGIPDLGRERGFIIPTDDNSELTVLIANFMPEKDLSSASLTRMEQYGRKQAWSYVKAFNEFMPGMENARLVNTGPSIAFRESRRLVGKETLTYDDTIQRIHREDTIARGGWKPEIHKSTVSAATYIDVPDSTWYDISLGMLESENIENLYGAGRFISADADAFAAVRVMGTCLASGQAAGAAAALKSLNNITDVKEVQKELISQGALL